MRVSGRKGRGSELNQKHFILLSIRYKDEVPMMAGMREHRHMTGQRTEVDRGSGSGVNMEEACTRKRDPRRDCTSLLHDTLITA